MNDTVTITQTAEPPEVLDFQEPNQKDLDFVDAGRVLILVGDPASKTALPMPLPAVFEQLFGILGDLDRRLMALEGEPKEKSKIITL